MILGKKLIAIIPVRGGSKGIPGKNMLRLGSLTLLERAILLAQKSAAVDKIIVSTDDQEMYDLASKYGVASKALRPAQLATAESKTIDVILHVLDELYCTDDYVLLLQATSPLRTLEDLNTLLKLFVEQQPSAKAIVSLVRQESPHPMKMQRIQGGFVTSLMQTDAHVPRQQLPEVYDINGAFYLTNASLIRSERTLLPRETIPYIMPFERSINLDSKYDLILLEALISKKIVELEDL